MGLPSGKLLAPKTGSSPVNGPPTDPNLSVSREIGRQRLGFFRRRWRTRRKRRRTEEEDDSGCENTMRTTGGRLRTRMLETGTKECKRRTDNEEDRKEKENKKRKRMLEVVRIRCERLEED